MRIIFILALLMHATFALADKEGGHLGIGYLGSSNEDGTGGRAEFGYLWDTGEPGGMHTGVALAYDSLGSKKHGGTMSAASIYLALEHEIANWVSFNFKLGPGSIQGAGSGSLGIGTAIGFTFFPVQNFGIELAGQAHTYGLDSKSGDSDTIASAAITFQFRF